jgi:hypothetical protein
MGQLPLSLVEEDTNASFTVPSFHLDRLDARGILNLLSVSLQIPSQDFASLQILLDEKERDWDRQRRRMTQHGLDGKQRTAVFSARIATGSCEAVDKEQFGSHCTHTIGLPRHDWNPRFEVGLQDLMFC